MADNTTSNIVTSKNVLNYSGLLWNHGDTRTPLFSMISGRRRNVANSEFVVGQYYSSPVANAQPAISESDSLTAPDAGFVTRTQVKNTTQIFQESVYISYVKMASMNELAGLNVAGQAANPTDEKSFQIGARMDLVRSQIEYSFVNGEYQAAANVSTAAKTKGIIEAISTNAITKVGTPSMTVWDVVEMSKAIRDSHQDTTNLVLMLNNINYLQLVNHAVANGMQILERDAEVNGISLTAIRTPYGTYRIALNDYVPAGTALLLNLSVMGVVEQPVPGKGNFFYEELAKTGAGEKGQIFGMAGLDFGDELCHAKVTGLATTWSAPVAPSI